MPPKVSREVAAARPANGKPVRSGDEWAREGFLAADPPKEFEGWGWMDTFHMIVYGPPKTGKTTFVSTFPGPILWGLASGSRQPGELKSLSVADRGKVRPFLINSAAQLAEFGERGRRYATVVMDHGTGLYDRLLAEVLGLDEMPVQKSWGLAQMEQYGEVKIKIQEFTRDLFSLPGHGVMVAQERLFGGSDDSEVMVAQNGPSFTDKLAKSVISSADFVVNTFVRPKTRMVKNEITQEMEEVKVPYEFEYCLRTGRDENYATGFRVPRGCPLPYCLVDPTFAAVQKVARGEWKS